MTRRDTGHETVLVAPSDFDLLSLRNSLSSEKEQGDKAYDVSKASWCGLCYFITLDTVECPFLQRSTLLKISLCLSSIMFNGAYTQVAMLFLLQEFLLVKDCRMYNAILRTKT